MRAPALLVTSAGSGVSAAIAEACRVTNRRERLVGLTIAPAAAAAAGYVDVRSSPPGSEPEKFQRFVLDEVRRTSGALVLAGRDDDVMLLAPLAESIRQAGGRWSGVVGELGSWGRDKLRVAQWLRAAGAPAAETVELGGARDLLTRSGYPLVAKPRFGDGSRGMRLIRDATDLASVESAGEAMVLQPLLRSCAGALLDSARLEQRDEVSMQMVVTTAGTAGPFATRNVLCEGRPVRAEAFHRPALEHLGRQVVEALTGAGLHGPVNVQAKETRPDHFEIFELNFRCTGLTGARAAMGFDELGALLGAAPRADAGLQAARRRLVAWRADPAAHGFRLTEGRTTCASR